MGCCYCERKPVLHFSQPSEARNLTRIGLSSLILTKNEYFLTKSM